MWGYPSVDSRRTGLQKKTTEGFVSIDKAVGKSPGRDNGRVWQTPLCNVRGGRHCFSCWLCCCQYYPTAVTKTADTVHVAFTANATAVSAAGENTALVKGRRQQLAFQLAETEISN